MSEQSSISIAMIVAMAENGVIGCDNQLPWHLPNDLKYFKARTMGKPVVMGRKTFESIGRPLPGRPNIVVTTNQAFVADGVHVVHSTEDALDAASQYAAVDGVDEVMIIGGAQLYADILSKADRLYLTRVHAQVEGDAMFPALDRGQWERLSCEDFFADSSNPYDYSFEVLHRSD